ncbi:MAG TPA: thiamine pyrophosphate-binding protein [Gemmatimonadaceae bacterium]|nr:thiamine pyrophosphate-binding protein [Gemmatimonadaceae bacterium]
MTAASITVAAYLKRRLEELGLDRVFTVAGNYTAPFLDTILEDKKSPIAITGMSNEMVAGYAADGYGRLRGLACVAVTYGVGAFSVLNAVAGSMVEGVPVVVINGAPTTKQLQNERNAGLLYSHMTTDPYSNLDVFRRITVESVRIVNALAAPAQIDAMLTACIAQHTPVYLEVLEDVWRAECAAPAGPLATKTVTVTKSNVDAAVKATLAMIAAHGTPLLWVGVEIQRMRLQQELLELLDATELHYTTSLLGKSVLKENHPRFLGVFAPNSPDEMKKLAGGAGCLIGLGAWTTGKDVNNQNIHGDKVALAAQRGVVVGPRYYPSVPLRDFIRAFREALTAPKTKITAYQPKALPMLRALAAKTPTGLTYDSFFAQIDSWLRPEHVVVCDAGFPLIGAQNLRIAAQDGFVAEAAWLSIGYSVGAAVGVKCAKPNERTLVFVGDGAFQETCQGVSAMRALGQNTVVFVLDNGIYGIEQRLVNPNPFRAPVTKYQPPLLNDIYSYNHMHPWAYERLADVFGGQGRTAKNVEELRAVLKEIDEKPAELFLVHVTLPATDTPAAVKPGLRAPGEDETLHPNWPPANIF